MLAAPPLVSIIMPAYNAEKFLALALDSVLAQTWPAWELIISDDGSTDRTRAIVARYQPAGRVRLLEQANQGPSAARNLALGEAHGAYVAFLDADDVWPANYLETMVPALECAPQAVAAYAGWHYIDETGQVLPQRLRPDPQRLVAEIHWRNPLVPAGVVVRRAALEACQGFDCQLRNGEDWDLWMRLLPHGPFVPVPAVSVGYRHHGANQTDNLERAEKDRLILLQKHLGSLDEPLEQWPALRRRAVGQIYFDMGLGYLRGESVDLAIVRLQQAVRHWPALLDEHELYYELGCAFQKRGFRGSRIGLRLEASAALIHALLYQHLSLPPGRRPAALWGHACLVLAQLAYDTGDPRASRRFALQALWRAPGRRKWAALRALARASLPAGAWRLARRRLSSARLRE